MRRDMKKYLFIGFKEDKDFFFKEAQKIGILEFKKPSKKAKKTISEKAERYSQSIKVLRGFVRQKQEIKKDVKKAEVICEEVLESKRELDDLQEELRKLHQEKQEILPFGYFSFETLAAIEHDTKKKFYFYTGKTSKHLARQDEELVLLNSENGIDYFIALSEMAIHIPDLHQVRVQKELQRLEKEIEEIGRKMSEKESHLKRLTRFNYLLHYALYEEMNHSDLKDSKERAGGSLDDNLFSVEAWVPENKEKELHKLLVEKDIFYQEVVIEESEVVPTYLENSGVKKIGEDLITIFDVPSFKDKDPSVWVLAFFALFFAMIVSDAGYGLIFLFIAWMIKIKKKDLHGLGMRMTKLVAILGISCTIWGLLVHSFFGIPMSLDNPIRKYSLMTYLVEKKAAFHMEKKDQVYTFWTDKIPELKEAQTSREFLIIGDKAKTLDHPASKFAGTLSLELALFIGALHIIVGFLRYAGRNPQGCGWIAFIIGGYLWLPHYLNASSLIHFVFGLDPLQAAHWGKEILIGGIGFSLVTSVVLNGLSGISDIMMIVQVFADILSYMRLYALGLSGAFISSLIAEMAGKAPLLIAIILVVFAHTLNIAIAIMGGVIHGLRLNFLEWYHYCFEGGGKQFQPLQLHVYD